MIYFVNAYTKEKIAYDYEPANRTIPPDMNKIAQQIVETKWGTFYAMTGNKRSGTYKIFDAHDIPCYMILALTDLTSLHYAKINSIAKGYTSKKILGEIVPYKGRYGIGYKWYTHCSISEHYRLVSYLVF